jgi:hypothetical protein
MVELVGQAQALIDEQVIEADADPRQRLTVVVDHSESKRDGHQERRQMVKMNHGSVA